MDTLQKAGTLQMLPKMARIDAMQCARQFDREYGVRLDWHEFSAYLDELAGKGILRRTYGRNDGMATYELNRGEA